VKKYQINKHFIPKELLDEEYPYEKTIKMIHKIKKQATPAAKLKAVITLKETLVK
jgi:hypothetical protein